MNPHFFHLRCNPGSPMSDFRKLILLPLAFILAFAAAPSAVRAQESTTLPQVRIVSKVGVIVNMYLCSGADLATCRDSTAAKLRREPHYPYPERDGFGGQQIQKGDSRDLGGVGSFALFVRHGGYMGPEWWMYLVDVTAGTPVPVTASVTGTLQTSGALAPVNGVVVTEGETILVIAPVIPSVVDFDIQAQTSSSPAVSFSVTRSRL